MEPRRLLEDCPAFLVAGGIVRVESMGDPSVRSTIAGEFRAGDGAVWVEVRLVDRL